MKKRMGFTLVEMLTVVVIIGILASITMRLMVYVNEKIAKTRTARDLEQIKHALTGFYAVYGIYPPVSSVEWRGKYLEPLVPPDKGLNYTDGLSKYLYDDPNTKKWIHFIEECKDDSKRIYRGSSGSSGNVEWTNVVVTIKDPWEQEYQYTCTEPYQSYFLYSTGPDGKTNTIDDIGRTWSE